MNKLQALETTYVNAWKQIEHRHKRVCWFEPSAIKEIIQKIENSVYFSQREIDSIQSRACAIGCGSYSPKNVHSFSTKLYFEILKKHKVTSIFDEKIPVLQMRSYDLWARYVENTLGYDPRGCNQKKKIKARIFPLDGGQNA